MVLLQKMRHPHIVSYVESFSLPMTNTLIIIMEYGISCEIGQTSNTVDTATHQTQNCTPLYNNVPLWKMK